MCVAREQLARSRVADEKCSSCPGRSTEGPRDSICKVPGRGGNAVQCSTVLYSTVYQEAPEGGEWERGNDNYGKGKGEHLLQRA